MARRCSVPRSRSCPTGARSRRRCPRCGPPFGGRGPRVWEKLKAPIESPVSHETDDAKRQALEWAMAVAAKRAGALLAGEPMSVEVAAESAKGDEVVLSKLRET